MPVKKKKGKKSSSKKGSKKGDKSPDRKGDRKDPMAPEYVPPPPWPGQQVEALMFNIINFISLD